MQCDPRHISLVIFHSQSKFYWSFSVAVIQLLNHEIKRKCCTCHDSRADVACAKFCSDYLIIFWMKAKGNFCGLWWKSVGKMVPWHQTGDKHSPKLTSCRPITDSCTMGGTTCHGTQCNMATDRKMVLKWSKTQEVNLYMLKIIPTISNFVIHNGAVNHVISIIGNVYIIFIYHHTQYIYPRDCTYINR